MLSIFCQVQLTVFGKKDIRVTVHPGRSSHQHFLTMFHVDDWVCILIIAVNNLMIMSYICEICRSTHNRMPSSDLPPLAYIVCKLLHLPFMYERF